MPSIQSVSPNAISIGSPDTTLTVSGSNFVQGSTVMWNGTALTTTFVSGTQLTATVPASALSGSAANVSVNVTNPGVGASSSIAVALQSPPPSYLRYPQTSMTTRVGLPVVTNIPQVNGPVTSYSVSPALPAGLNLNTSNGAIYGTPTAAAVQANYTLKATNAGGNTTASISITVNPASTVLLELGNAGGISTLRMSSTRVLSSNTSHWVLWDYAAGSILANGDECGPCGSFNPAVDMAGSTIVIGEANGLEIRSSLDGHLLSIINTPANAWWKLASDGSYVVSGLSAGLLVYAPTAQVLASKSGDYSKANVFAAPGSVQVALGAAGANVLETISTADGTSSIGPTFSGQFNSWFVDGARFLTNQSTVVWTYSKDSVQQSMVTLPSVSNLTGGGNWVWTYDSSTNPPSPLTIYPINSSSPSATYPLNNGATVVPSGSTLGVIDSGSGTVAVVDLSGSTPSSTTTNTVFPSPSGYAAMSPTLWLTGNAWGVISDGSSAPGSPRYFGYGQAWSITGSSSRLAIATATGSILYYVPGTTTPEGTITFPSSKIQITSDGTQLAAESSLFDSRLGADRSLIVYSLPSGAVTNAWHYIYGTYPFVADFGFALSGATIGRVLENSGTTATRVVTATTGGPSIWTDSLSSAQNPIYIPIQLSPDGTLVAVPNQMPGPATTTTIYKDGALVTAIPGWPAGWIDNGRLLVINYTGGSHPGYSGSTIYDGTGTVVTQLPSLPELWQIQPVASDTIFSYWGVDAIYSVTTGATVWSSPNSSGAGAVAGSYVVYTSGSQVLMDTY